MGIKTTKDFIKQNAVETIMSVPKKPAKNFVDTKKGDKQPLEPSGLEPKYINKKVSCLKEKLLMELELMLFNGAWSQSGWMDG